MRQRIFITLLITIVAIPLLAYAGTLTMTSYYPAPTGNYDRINANNIGVGTVNVGSTLSVGGQGTGYASIGSSNCGAGYTGINLTGIPMANCYDYSFLGINSSAHLYINRPTGGSILFRERNNTVTTVNQMILAASPGGAVAGNVGLNMNGPPTRQLDVNGDAVLSSATPRLYFGGATTSLFYPAANTLTFYTNSAENMRLDANGNLGIGISPTSRLHVSGTTNMTGAVTMGSTANIASNATIGGNANITGNTTVGGTATIAGATTMNTTATVGGTLTAGGLASLNAGATITGVTTINNGSLSINNAGTLSVTGNSTLSGLVGIGGAATNNLYPLNLQGSLQVTGGSIYNADGGYFYGASDRRLKEKVRPIENAVAKVQKLNGVTFRWKKDHKKSVGVISQDVEKVFPELVYTDKQGMKSVAYPNLIAVLIEATKEQQRQIDVLKKEVALLKKQNKK